MSRPDLVIALPVLVVALVLAIRDFRANVQRTED